MSSSSRFRETRHNSRFFGLGNQPIELCHRKIIMLLEHFTRSAAQREVEKTHPPRCRRRKTGTKGWEMTENGYWWTDKFSTCLGVYWNGEGCVTWIQVSSESHESSLSGSEGFERATLQVYCLTTKTVHRGEEYCYIAIVDIIIHSVQTKTARWYSLGFSNGEASSAHRQYLASR